MIIRQAGYKPYFKPIWKFVDDLGCQNSWEHIDLFLIRETSGTQVKKMIKIAEDKSFFSEQLKIAASLMRGLKPKVIIVINALASHIILGNDKWQEYSLPEISNEYDTRYGCYWFDQHIPTLFSGMLSGQHSIDSGSRQRLLWHVKQLPVCAD